MNFIKKLLGLDTPAPGNEGFWTWFQLHERSFYDVVRTRDTRRIEGQFLKRIIPALEAIQGTLYCETGMCSDTMAELVISAQGDVKSFVFVEDLVALAPTLANWKFTALKPANGVEEMRIKMEGYTFDNENIHFYYHDDPEYPDEIEITFVHQDLTGENKTIITQGVFLYLESLLGEHDAATLIDKGTVTGPSQNGTGPAQNGGGVSQDGGGVSQDSGGPSQNGGGSPIPMGKLADFLRWKEKEFVEKYHESRHQTENDNYAVLEGKDEDGFANVVTLNTDLLQWDAKVSHPWMMLIVVDYEKTNGLAGSGMPDTKHYQHITRLEKELAEKLPDSAGYLILARQTYKGKRTIFLACKEFRQASKTTQQLLETYYPDLSCSYEIYKDKYWKTMEPFGTVDTES
jgi:hypothetical protein